MRLANLRRGLRRYVPRDGLDQATLLLMATFLFFLVGAAIYEFENLTRPAPHPTYESCTDTMAWVQEVYVDTGVVETVGEALSEDCRAILRLPSR